MANFLTSIYDARVDAERRKCKLLLDHLEMRLQSEQYALAAERFVLTNTEQLLVDSGVKAPADGKDGNKVGKALKTAVGKAIREAGMQKIVLAVYDQTPLVMVADNGTLVSRLARYIRWAKEVETKPPPGAAKATTPARVAVETTPPVAAWDVQLLGPGGLPAAQKDEPVPFSIPKGAREVVEGENMLIRLNKVQRGIGNVLGKIAEYEKTQKSLGVVILSERLSGVSFASRVADALEQVEAGWKGAMTRVESYVQDLKKPRGRWTRAPMATSSKLAAPALRCGAGVRFIGW